MRQLQLASHFINRLAHLLLYLFLSDAADASILGNHTDIGYVGAYEIDDKKIEIDIHKYDASFF
jgi:hypothetical protein